MTKVPVALFLALVLLIGLDDCRGAISAKDTSMTASPSIKTVCVGHYLLDLPVGSNIKVDATYMKVRAESLGRQKDFTSVKKDVEAKIASLSEQKMRAVPPQVQASMRARGEDPGKLIASDRMLGVSRGVDYVVYGYHNDSKDSRFNVELHKIFNNDYYKFTSSGIGAARYAETSSAIVKTVSRFTPVAAGQVPQSPGFCVGNGVYAEKSQQDVGGDAQLYVTFPKFQGLAFSMTLRGIAKPSKEGPVAQRMNRDLAELSRLSKDLKILRRGKRSYGGQMGEEIAISSPMESSSGRMYKFFWQASGAPLDPYRPELEVELMTNDDKSQSIGEDQIEALWTQVMESLRIRNGS